MDIETDEDMIRVRENYLGDIVKAAWESFKLKFPNEIIRITSQGNNIPNFCYAIDRLLIARDANIGFDLRQKEIMQNLE